ncbi:cytosolic non-specific dipeptidase-like [Drosophila subobscura]|uniref:cytosolic non-specific dipeptidase-like n=1 Tax=Drosophila subobscura TaxID=7241 RepID=UPI00155AAF97|nr:cytosolic non-specific dipeptidase-like [Drosophila subobscura]
MICWGQRNECGLLCKDDSFCRCGIGECVKDFPVHERVHWKETELADVVHAAHLRGHEFLKNLASLVQIRSISQGVEYETQNRQIVERVTEHLAEMAFIVETMEVKPSVGGSEQTQYVIFAEYFSSPAKTNVVIYGYLDVPPIGEEEKWTHDPFKMTQLDGTMYGRGVATSKGPLMCWIYALDAWQKEIGDLPVNVRFVIETSHYQGSHGLRGVIHDRPEFFRTVDLIIHCSHLWIAEHAPMVPTSHTGYIYFELEVRENKQASPEKTATTGHEPMTEMCQLMNSLMDIKNGVLVKDINRHVMPPTHKDWDIFCLAEVGTLEFKDTCDIDRLPYERSKQQYLKHKWCLPSLSIHDVRVYQPESIRSLYKPTRIVAKFSVLLVPEQSMEYVRYLVKDHLDQAYLRLKCVHIARIRVVDQLAPLNESRHDIFRKSFKDAFDRVFDCKVHIPDTITISLPIVNDLRKFCMPTAHTLAVPFASIHNRPYTGDESISEKMYGQNMELFLTLLYEMAMQGADCKCKVEQDYCFKPGHGSGRDFRHMVDLVQTTHVVLEMDAAVNTKKEKLRETLKRSPDAKDVLLGEDRERTLQ